MLRNGLSIMCSSRKFSLARRRMLSSVAEAPRDTRLAGRRRFYKHVATQPSSTPPWASSEHTIDSPISGGVDGTQSASGVANQNLSAGDLQSVLQMERLDKDDSWWYTITLDGRQLKTPMQALLSVPSPVLATAIAVEWDNQKAFLQPANMPLTTLVCTTLDQTTRTMEHVQNECLRFVATDTICYWEDPMVLQDSTNRGLYQKQSQHWQPIHDLVEEHSGGHRLAQMFGSSEGVLVAKNCKNLPHPPELYEFASNYVTTGPPSQSAWHLTIFSSMIRETKSFWLSWALMEDLVDADQAIQAARVEEEFQIQNWGLVEGGHDYDRLNTSIPLRAAAFMRDCLQQQQSSSSR